MNIGSWPCFKTRIIQLSRSNNGLLALRDFLAHQREVCMDREKDIFLRPSSLNPGHFHVDLLEGKSSKFLWHNCLGGFLQREFLTVVLSRELSASTTMLALPATICQKGLSMFPLAMSSIEVLQKTTVPNGCCHPLPICISINSAV